MSIKPPEKDNNDKVNELARSVFNNLSLGFVGYSYSKYLKSFTRRL